MGERRIVKGWIVERGADGQLVPISPAGGQGGPPRDPTFDLQAPKVQADIAQSQAGTVGTYANARGQDIDNRIKTATADAAIRSAQAKAAADELALANARKEANPAASPENMAAVREEAQRKIALLDSLTERSASWLRPGATGAGANLLKYWGGSPAFDQAADVETVSSAGALTKVMEMAKANGGKNPLTPLSEGDFANIAKSISNLDVGQSDAQFQKNAGTYRDIYSRALRGAGGVDTTRLSPTDGMNALQQGYASLTQQMQGKTPAQRQAMLRAYDSDPRIQSIKQRAGFRDPGGRASTAGAPRKPQADPELDAAMAKHLRGR